MNRRVCLITTTRHNVGDDFVREGILWLLRKVLGPVDALLVHKHFPATARGGVANRVDVGTRGWGERARRALSALVDLPPLGRESDLVLGADLVVQCGAPVYWKNAYSSCAGTEWYGPLVRRRWRRVKDAVPLLNLGAGSCQPLGANGAEVWQDAACREFIAEFHSHAKLTTVRDELAREIVEQCGGTAPLLPCPSLFAPAAAGIRAGGTGGYVALNYMPGAGHFDLSGDGARLRAQWETYFPRMVKRIAKDYPCRVICHDRADEAAAARLLPELPRILATDWRACLEAYAGCRYAVVNRVHGGAVAAALGRPALVIGNDSRLLTLKGWPGVTALPVTASEAELGAGLDTVMAQPRAEVGPFAADAERESLCHLGAALA